MQLEMSSEAVKDMVLLRVAKPRVRYRRQGNERGRGCGFEKQRKVQAPGESLGKPAEEEKGVLQKGAIGKV